MTKPTDIVFVLFDNLTQLDFTAPAAVFSRLPGAVVHVAAAADRPVTTDVVRDGNVFTAGGVTAGIDFGLLMAAEIAGEPTARAIQLALEYDPDPPYRCGAPEQADTETIDQLKQLVYTEAAAAMGEALDAAMQ